MKAKTYIEKIKKENACSIHTAEKLTEALHRENILHPDLSVRFRPLWGDFDIIETEWLHNGFNRTIDEDDNLEWYAKPFENPDLIINYARNVSNLYRGCKA